MENTILFNNSFNKLNNLELILSNSFNPNKVLTSREKYVLLNKLNIYEGIYEYI